MSFVTRHLSNMRTQQSQNQLVNDYYNRLTGVLESPNGFGFTPEEEEQMMNQQAREGELGIRQASTAYDQWAARMGIQGGSQASAKLKLYQENLRNLMRARTSLNQLNMQQRAQARLAALSGLGGMAQQVMSYQQQRELQEQAEQQSGENLLGTVLGYGVKYGLNYLFPGAGTAAAAATGAAGGSGIGMSYYPGMSRTY